MATTYTDRFEVQRLTGLANVTDAEINTAEDDVDRRLGSRGTYDATTGREIVVDPLKPRAIKPRAAKYLAAAVARQVEYRRAMSGTGIFVRAQREKVEGPDGVKATGALPTFSPHAEAELDAGGFFGLKVRSYWGDDHSTEDDRCWVRPDEWAWQVVARPKGDQ